MAVGRIFLNLCWPSRFVDEVAVTAYTSPMQSDVQPPIERHVPIAAAVVVANPDRRLRILITSQYFWPEPFPINDLARALVERGHAVTVLTGLPNHQRGTFFPGYGLGGPWRETHDGVDVRRVPLVPRGAGGRMRIAINHLSYALSGTLLGPLRARGRFDVVIASQPSPLISVIPGTLVSWLKSIPMVLWVQDLWPESLAIAGVHSTLIWQAMERVMRLVYRRADLVLVQSRAFRGHAFSRGVAPDKVKYFPNWAEPHYRALDRETAALEDSELPKGFRIVFGGNLGEAQALGTIVEAASRLRDRAEIKIIFIGDGRRRGWLESEIERRGLTRTVFCVGHRPAERMPAYYAVADALLLSLNRNETMAKTIPSKLQAYLASGRPIIAALDGEAQRIVVASGAGVGCRAEDPQALADTIGSLASSTLWARAAMGQAAQACYQEEFNRSKLIDELEGWLNTLTATRARSIPVRSENG